MKKGKSTEDRAISRRRFIKTAGIALGVGAAACGGAAYFGLSTPSSVDFPEMACKLGDGRRVLLAYASKCGAAAETADFIGQRLCEKGCDVEVKRARNVRDIASYQAVILGSAVYMSKLLGEAERFAADHLAGLSDVPVAFFDVCLAAKGLTSEDQAEALAYMEPLRAYVTPAAVAAFPGRIALETLPPLYRMIAQADSEGILAPGDYRNWEAVSAWVDTLPAGFVTA
jgi:menaquinone-dependent protoporphyrinogen oxidase